LSATPLVRSTASLLVVAQAGAERPIERAMERRGLQRDELVDRGDVCRAGADEP
jgi:hypothetical protein